MKKILSFLFGVSCVCGDCVAPFFSGSVSVYLSGLRMNWKGFKCKCGRVHMPEDGYWITLTPEMMEEISRCKENQKIMSESPAPDLSKWGI